MSDDFSRYLIKEYAYWKIFLHPNKGYLGRCVLWCTRDDAFEITDATQEEQEELFIILKNLRSALVKSFSPDWFNYSFLGNIDRHLHAHIIPRYEKERTFEKIIFKDELYGKNYSTDIHFTVPDEVIMKILGKIKENL